MHVVTTNTSGWIDGSNTAIRVEFEDDAKAEADKWNGPGEDMVERCFWRLLYERWEEVQGPSVTFTLTKCEVQGLIERLNRASTEALN